MFWITLIIIAIFVLPTILGIVLGVKTHNIANDNNSTVDWWTVGMMADIHNKSRQKDK